MTEAERFVKSIYPGARCIKSRKDCFIWTNSQCIAAMTLLNSSKISQEQAWEYAQRAIERKMISALEG